MGYRRFGIVVCLFLASLTISAGASDDLATPDADAAYYLIGVAPETAAPVFDTGEIVDGNFDSDSAFGGDHQPPVDGFVLVKAEKDRLMGITKVGFETPAPKSSGGLMALLARPVLHSMGKKDYTNFTPCYEIPTLTFTPQSGHVLYITSIEFTYHDNGFSRPDILQFTLTSDIDGARSFLEKHYPVLAPRLEQGTYQTPPLKAICPR